MLRKITLTIDQVLLDEVRALAARRNCSVSALLSEELSRLVACVSAEDRPAPAGDAPCSTASAFPSGGDHSAT